MTTNVDELISSFLQIAVDQNAETARRFLDTTNWNIDEAINLFLINNNNNNNYDSSRYHHQVEAAPRVTTLAPRHDDESWNDSRLSHLYRPPLDLLYQGSFQDAKSVSSEHNLWLLVNLQSRTEFASHVLNRDVWSNTTVSEAVKSSFILLQVYDDTIEGQKISSFYKIDNSALPVVLLIDPITGQKMRMWRGVIEPQSLVEDFIKFMDAGPQQHIASLTRTRRPEKEHTCPSRNRIVQVAALSWGEEFQESTASEKEETCSTSNHVEESLQVKEKKEETCLGFPVLTEEPKGDCDRSVTCSICVRLPDGSRKQRRFLKSEPIQLLWSFCYAHMMEGSENKAFKLVQVVPGASKTLDYGANVTFHQSGLENSMISVLWE